MRGQTVSYAAAMMGQDSTGLARDAMRVSVRVLRELTETSGASRTLQALEQHRSEAIWMAYNTGRNNCHTKLTGWIK